MRAPVVLLPIAAACAGGSKAGPAAGGADSAAELDLLSALRGPGPWSVGYGTEELTWQAPDGPRALRVALWYPTDATSGEPVRNNGLLEGDGVRGGAEPADGTFPLHVYSHGHQGFAEASAFLFEHFASHGVLVAAPDHTGNTTFDSPDRQTPIYVQRPGDVSAVLDHALDPPAGHPFAGRADPGRVTASGHSFGGYTLHALGGATYDEALIVQCLSGEDTSAYCTGMDEGWAEALRGGFRDDRIRALLSMAPGDYRLFGAPGLAQIGAPILHMTGSLDPQTGADAEPIWAALQGGEARRLSITGGGHMTFTDFSGVLESIEGLMPADEGFDIVRAYGLGWIELHGGGALDARPLFDGELEVSPAATVLR